jgi:SAM-dependent MidA family methyltransferase
MTGSSRDLIERLKNIAAKKETNQLRFDEFMREVLWHPQLGYYARAGKNCGHYSLFSTDPATGEVYGQVLGLQLEQMWHWLDQPEPFTFIEQSPNDARTPLDLLRWTQKYREEMFDALQVHIIEAIPALSDLQKKYVEEAGFSEKVTWHEKPEELRALQPLHGVFYSNEYVDSLPTRIVFNQNDTWRERLVHWNDRKGRFEFVLGDLPEGDPLLQAIERWDIPQVRNYQAEACLELGDFIHAAAQCLESGFIITVAFGYDAGTLYHPNRINGSMRCYTQQSRVPDCLSNPGAYDITLSVNYSALEELGEEAGLLNLGTVRHSDAMKALAHESYQEFRDTNWNNQDPAIKRIMQAFRNLLFPPINASSYRLLVQAKGFDAANPPEIEAVHKKVDA